MLKLFSLENLNSIVVKSDVLPWEIPQAIPSFANKEAFRSWCNSSDTKDCFFSTYEGINPATRINKENPAIKAHGFVADFDAVVEDSLWTGFLANCNPDAKPFAKSKTYSNHARLVWAFEEPVLVHEDMWEPFLKVMARGLKVQSILPGYDPASEKQTQYFHRGNNWEILGNKIPSAVVNLWLFEACTKRKIIRDTFNPPIEEIAAEIQSRWPGVWPGEFAVGSRGPLFWLGDGVERVGCQVAPDGVICYSTRAGIPFKSWESLLGKKFMEKYQQIALDEMTQGIWYDGQSYFFKNDDTWRDTTRADLTIHFRVSGLFSSVARGQSASDVDRALHYIHKTRRVDVVAPHCFEPELLYNGRLRILNTANVSPLVPAEGVVGWGEGFPWLAEFFDNWFSSEEQKRPFLAWVQQFYRGATEHKPKLGSVCILCGPVQRGKSLLAKRIVGGLVGGYTEASDFLSGETSFNSRLFESPLWGVDDTTNASDPRRHTLYSATIKKAAAGSEWVMNEKFRKAYQIWWKGRVIISLNDDPESISAIPSLDSSIMDKLNIYRCADREFVFPKGGLSAVDSTIANELPYFGAWLLAENFEDQHESNRYGLRAYHEPTVVANAQDSLQGGHIAELLDPLFAKKLERALKEHNQTSYRFTASDLYSDMAAVNPNIVGQIKISEFRNYLKKLSSRTSYDYELRKVDTKYTWEVSHR